MDELLEPPIKWMAREVNESHVNQIAEGFKRNPFSHKNGRPWVVIADISKKQYLLNRSLGQCNKFLIAGRHRRAALLKV